MKKSFKKSCNFLRAAFPIPIATPIAIVLFCLFLLALPAYAQNSIQDESQLLTPEQAQLDTEESSANAIGEKTSPADEKVYEKKNSGLAWLFSYLLPGGGQFYLGEIALGAVFVSVHLVSLSILIGGATTIRKSPSLALGLLGFSMSLLAANWLASWIMAPISALKRNKQIDENNLGQYRGTDTVRNSFGHLLEGGGAKLVWGFDMSPNFKKSVALDSDKKAEGLTLNGFSLSLSFHY